MFIEWTTEPAPDAGPDGAHRVRLAVPGHAGPVTLDVGDAVHLVTGNGRAECYAAAGVYEVVATDALGRVATTTIHIPPTMDAAPSTVELQSSPVAEGPGDRPAAEPDASHTGSAARRSRTRKGV